MFGQLGIVGAKGGKLSKVALTLPVPTSAGALMTVVLPALSGSITYTKTGVSSDLSIGSSTGVVTSAAGINPGVSERITGYGQDVDGNRQVFDITLTGIVSKPVNTAAPVVSGSLAVGSVLSCTTGSWSNGPTGYSYQWYWADTGDAIPGASSATYTSVSGDTGHTIACAVLASNSAGSALLAAPSNIIGPVTAVPANDNNLDLGSANNSGFAFFYGAL